MKSTWSRILEEINQLPAAPGQPSPFDTVRRQKAKALAEFTKRPLVVYATAFTVPQKSQVPPQLLQIDFSDKLGFHDILEHLEGPHLDVLIHSPGGYAEAAQALVEQIRLKFENVRFIVPQIAKSAATMLVLSGNTILMEPEAELGPIDPQIPTIHGFSPAEAIREQFRQAEMEISKDAKKLAVWVPILQQYGPALLVQCQNAIALSKELVTEWLARYMWKEQKGAKQRAKKVAEFLSRHQEFKSHGRGVRIPDLERLKLNVVNLRTQPELQAKVWELYCAIDITLANTNAAKIIENHLGHAIIRGHGGQPVFQFQLGPPPPHALPQPRPDGGEQPAPSLVR